MLQGVDLMIVNLDLADDAQAAARACCSRKNILGDSPADSIISQGVMATLQKRRLGYHSQMGLEPGFFGLLTLHIDHYCYYATRKIIIMLCRHHFQRQAQWPSSRHCGRILLACRTVLRVNTVVCVIVTVCAPARVQDHSNRVRAPALGAFLCHGVSISCVSSY
jgi:hypothetical protein